MNPLFLFLLPIVLVSAQDLRVGFYNSNCPQAESIVKAVVQKHFGTDPSVPAALLRMYFHDCFVRVSNSSSNIFLVISPPFTLHATMNAFKLEFNFYINRFVPAGRLTIMYVVFIGL